MMGWIFENTATIIISVLLAGITFLVTRYLRRKGKEGTCPGCSGCAGSSGNCGYKTNKKVTGGSGAGKH